ncbi:MAG: hypothetical protein WBY94_08585 [Polyangiaceae bacterium]
MDEKKIGDFRQQRLLDELFMAFLHRVVEEGELDVEEVRELVPDHLRPWFDANVELAKGHHELLPLRPSVMEFTEWGPDELLEAAEPIRAHSHGGRIKRDLDKFENAVAKKAPRRKAAKKGGKRKPPKAATRGSNRKPNQAKGREAPENRAVEPKGVAGAPES